MMMVMKAGISISDFMESEIHLWESLWDLSKACLSLIAL